ncbi:hypothetical protein ACB092_08G149900 [Castanea dentata]
MEGTSSSREALMIGGVSREVEVSIAASTMFPGFRFSPTDEELISYYLKKKLEGYEQCVEVISEVEMCRHEPWDLPAKSIIQSDNEWFFFSPRGRKYPNGSQSRRATEMGYWKATGKERTVKSGTNVIGTKRTLVFHTGRAPKGERTEWIMHEYCMTGVSQDSLVICRLRKNSEFRLNDSSNRASPSQRITFPTSNGAVSEVGIDQTGLSEGDRAAGSFSDSHSIDQMDSTSESEPKLSTEVTLTKTSSLQKETDFEEDWFTDILNDDIIKLDESSLSLVMGKSEVERKDQEPVQAIVSRVVPIQGTANRRIQLRLLETMTSAAEVSESLETGNDNYVVAKDNCPLETGNDNYVVVRDNCPNQDKQPKCLLDMLSPKTTNHWRVSVVFVILALLALFVSLLGGSKQVKRITYAALYERFWQRM